MAQPNINAIKIIKEVWVRLTGIKGGFIKEQLWEVQSFWGIGSYPALMDNRLIQVRAKWSDEWRRLYDIW